jgi:hypothetical protein
MGLPFAFFMQQQLMTDKISLYIVISHMSSFFRYFSPLFFADINSDLCELRTLIWVGRNSNLNVYQVEFIMETKKINKFINILSRMNAHYMRLSV